eukprot:TRINITY_DN10578_c0_g3_i1.p1 TRINITY_DN10578_c0_g3~~TRINITY_DN10578_c0_g3_i1.p1  ORF type:complete len:652 (+),score=35.27 TRINITY_DN10578_c0_g3_i1:109-2064(+)
MQTSLVAIAHWAPRAGHLGPSAIRWQESTVLEPPDFRSQNWANSDLKRHQDDRSATLLKTLEAIAAWPVEAKVVLVTNVAVPVASRFVSEQVIIDRPRCDPGHDEAEGVFSHEWCMPWEAIRVLRERGLLATGLENGGVYDFQRPSMLRLKYDSYVYLEDDIVVPGSAFEFWSRYVDDVFRSGYFLSTFCFTEYKKTNYVDPPMSCNNITAVHVPLNSSSQTKTDPEEHAFFANRFLNGRGWLMSRLQFQYYLGSNDWDWIRASYIDKFWGMRESAYLSPLRNHRFLNKVVSHRKLAVHHAAFSATFAGFFKEGEEFCTVEQLIVRTKPPERTATRFNGLGRFPSPAVDAPVDAPAEDLHTVLRSYFVKITRSDRSSLGCRGVTSVLSFLKPTFDRPVRRGVFVDVGANTGKSVEAIAKVFGTLAEQPRRGTDDCEGYGRSPIRMFAFEPEPDTYQQLLAYTDGWADISLKLAQLAVSDKPGWKTLYTLGDNDAGATIFTDEKIIANATKVPVKVTSLDEFVHDKYEVEFIFLLHISAGGADYAVLRGAHYFLKKQRVNFIVFEYGEAWLRALASLKIAVQYLYSFGYACFFITKLALVPLYEAWWDDVYQHLRRANVLCGVEKNPALLDAYFRFGVNNYTFRFAQHFLIS